MKNISLIIMALVLIALVGSSAFVVPEHQQAIILQLGKVIGEPITEPGLKFKLSFIQDVKFFDKRILQYDGERGVVPTADKKFIWVDTTARWRIKDPLLFYKTSRDVNNALARMKPILDGATRDSISAHNLIESVRNTNKIIADIEEHLRATKERAKTSLEDTTLDELAQEVEPVIVGREKLSAMIAVKARQGLDQFGIDLIDVHLRSIAYQEAVELKVYESMISERRQIAEKIRSSGKGEEAKIQGQLSLALKRIESEAYRKSQALRGEAAGTAIDIYAKSLKADPSYYEFVKTLDSYKKTLANKGEFILSTDNAFLSLLNKGG